MVNVTFEEGKDNYGGLDHADMTTCKHLKGNNTWMLALQSHVLPKSNNTSTNRAGKYYPHQEGETIMAHSKGHC